MAFCPNHKLQLRTTESGVSHRITREQWIYRSIKMILYTGLSLYHFENPHIRLSEIEIADDAGIAYYQPPSRKIVATTISVHYQEACQTIKKILLTQNIINFSYDESTCNAGQRIFNITYYISHIDSFLLININLDYRR